MCGRYTLRKAAQEFAEDFNLPEMPPLEPRYNIAPTQQVPAVRFNPDRGGRELTLYRWGLIPSWAEDPSIGNRMINARAETAAVKPAYRKAFQVRRCLVIADGFYEWRKLDGRKQPYFIHRKDDRPFAFAGLWENWERDTGTVQSCTHLTTVPNELVAPIHDRMPVILTGSAYDLWLDPDVKDPRKLLPFLVPFPADEMEAYPVVTLVDSPGNDVAGCITRAD